MIEQTTRMSVSAAAASERPATAIAEADIDNIAIDSQANTARQQDEHLAPLSNLELGTWFIFNADTPEPQRVKLAWFDTSMLNFMFVNRIGQQVGVRTARQLSRDIRHNKVTILNKLETRPFFEKAMQRVLEQLKQRETSDESKNL